MDSSEAATIIIDRIYPRLYFSLSRLPARPSSTKLNERQFSILLLVEANSKEEKILTIGEISEICKLSSSDATRKIKELEKKGFVRKSVLDSDDRSKEVFLTDQWRQTLLAEKWKRKQWFEKILEALEEKERDLLIDIIRKFSESLIVL